jgi:hypothetical protein
MRHLFLVGFCVLGLAISRSASADTISLSTADSGVSQAGPYGRFGVDLLATGNEARITLESNLVSGDLFIYGGSGSMFLNTNGAVTWEGDVSNIDGVTPHLSQHSGDAVEGGFGSFNFALDDSDALTVGGFYNLTFTIRLNSGTWSSAADVLTPNADGSSVGGHIIDVVKFSGFTEVGGNGYTVDGAGVPDGGSTAGLLGSALVGLGLLRRKFGKA